MKHTDVQTHVLRPTSFAPQVAARPVQAAACGKAILVGEHAVVYGARAVAMPVTSLQMSVRLTPTNRRDKHGAPQTRVTLGGRLVTPHLSGVVDDAFSVLGLAPFPVDLEGNSTVTIGAGLGSSASLCVVILRALAEAAQMPLTRYELAQYANQLEKRFHGNPSGLDTAAVAMGHVISFVKGTAPLEVPLVPSGDADPWRFALLDSGVRASTLAMIQATAPYFHGGEGERRLAGFDALAAAVAHALGSGDAAAVAEGMLQAGAWLDEAGVVTQVLQELIGAAAVLGCPAKPTGAGGGGCVLALLAREHADAQLVALRERIGGTRVCAVELK